ncbi:MAG: hypothetical protein HZB29_00430 [Nitrospinae bacterium]|nr:hypothetical protein [Nitrospinota bacterium]
MRFRGFKIVSIMALIGAAMASCASLAQKVSANTEVKLEKVFAENPLSQTITLAKELVGATIGAPSEGRDSDLMLTVKMYLKNNNSFDLDLMRVSYTLTRKCPKLS